MKYINILKEKDELIQSKKDYEIKMQKIISESKAQNQELTKAQKEVEMLKKKLLEKDKKISQLEKVNNDLNSRSNNTNASSTSHQKTNSIAKLKQPKNFEEDLKQSNKVLKNITTGEELRQFNKVLRNISSGERKNISSRNRGNMGTNNLSNASKRTSNNRYNDNDKAIHENSSGFFIRSPKRKITISPGTKFTNKCCT